MSNVISCLDIKLQQKKSDPRMAGMVIWELSDTCWKQQVL